MSFLPRPSYIIPSASCGELILLISGLLLCIFFFAKISRQIHLCFISPSFLHQESCPTYTLLHFLFFPLKVTACPFMEMCLTFLHVSICGRLSWPQIICCFSLKKLESLSSPLELGMTLWIVLSNACGISDILELPNTDLQRTMGFCFLTLGRHPPSCKEA